MMAGLVLGLGLAACGGSTPSGATCPDTSALTYDNFGKQFMEDYCLGCHSSTKTGKERDGAPNSQNYDLIADIRAHAKAIDLEAAAGPDATNESMPPESPYPSATERQQLGEWLACGAP